MQGYAEGMDRKRSVAKYISMAASMLVVVVFTLDMLPDPTHPPQLASTGAKIDEVLPDPPRAWSAEDQQNEIRNHYTPRIPKPDALDPGERFNELLPQAADSAPPNPASILQSERASIRELNSAMGR